jgi:hypothetical protein
VKLEQRYAKATQSSNLKCDDRHHDTDSLAAVALSGEFGGLLFRVKYSNDATSFNRLQEEWRWHIKKRAAVDGWPEHIKEQKVADDALHYWLNDVCPACTGKGHPTIKYTPVLDEDACTVCEGTGKKPMVFEARAREYILDALVTLERMTIAAAGLAMAKLAGDMEL